MIKPKKEGKGTSRATVVPARGREGSTPGQTPVGARTSATHAGHPAPYSLLRPLTPESHGRKKQDKGVHHRRPRRGCRKAVFIENPRRSKLSSGKKVPTFTIPVPKLKKEAISWGRGHRETISDSSPKAQHTPMNRKRIVPTLPVYPLAIRGRGRTS